jgi:hypothetical protein
MDNADFEQNEEERQDEEEDESVQDNKWRQEHRAKSYHADRVSQPEGSCSSRRQR